MKFTVLIDKSGLVHIINPNAIAMMTCADSHTPPTTIYLTSGHTLEFDQSADSIQDEMESIGAQDIGDIIIESSNEILEELGKLVKAHIECRWQ